MSVLAYSELREAVIRLRSRVEEAVRTMSLAYSYRKAIPSMHWRTNKDVSEREHERGDDGREALVPCMRSLLETV
jgi:hypothetical protein